MILRIYLLGANLNCTVGLEYAVRNDTDDTITCQPCRSCPQGFFHDAGCELFSDRTCRRCSACIDFKFMLEYTARECDQDGNTVCEPIIECTSDQYTEQEATPTTQRICQNYTQCVAGVEYEAEMANMTRDRVCLPIRQCDRLTASSLCTLSETFNTTLSPLECFTKEPGTNVSDATCELVSPLCSPGTFQTASPTISTDRICVTCPVEEYQPNTNQTSCLPMTQCQGTGTV